VLRDLSRLRRDEAEIRRLAYFDPLTGLPNRRLFIDRLDSATVSSDAEAFVHQVQLIQDWRRFPFFDPHADRRSRACGRLRPGPRFCCCFGSVARPSSCAYD
jgi:hypothetical protein